VREEARRLARRRLTADVTCAPVDAREAPRRVDAVSVRAEVQARLFEELGERDLLAEGEDAVREAVHDFVERLMEEDDVSLNEEERERLAQDLLEEALGVGPLAPLMGDPAVTDILVNGPDDVYVERYGRLEPAPVAFRDAEHIQRIIERLAMRVGRRIDQSWPMVDLRLPDGSRVNATIPPASIDGPTISIRRFGRRRLRMVDLLRHDSLDEAMSAFLRAVVRGRLNVLISGGTGAGKSTLLGAMCEAIAGDERVVTIEDTAELALDQRHVVRLETRPANVEGRGLITARDLVVNALRMRPSRIIVGEVRSAEALDMLQAMNTGHEGSLTTIHANGPRDALARLETLCLMSGTELPSFALREQVAAAIQIVVHVQRDPDGRRRVVSVSELTGMEGTTLQLQDVFRFERGGVAGGGGHYVATGIVPRVLERLRERGADLAVETFVRDAER